MRSVIVLTGLAASLLALPAAAQQVKPGCTDSSRACLLTVAKTYLDGIVTHDGSKALLHPKVRRVEQGDLIEEGEAAIRKSLFMEPDMLGLRSARYFVDEKKNTVLYFAVLPTRGTNADKKREAYDMGGKDQTIYLAERIKVEGGLITEIEAVYFPKMGSVDGQSHWPEEAE